MKRTSELLEKRRRIVKEEVEAGKQKGVKISYTIDRLKERFLVSEKTLYNDLYHGTPDADEGKNKY